MNCPCFQPLSVPKNPLIQPEKVGTVRLEEIRSPTLCSRPQSARRELRDLRRVESARDAVRGLDRSRELYGWTKGQFSLLDLLIACLDHTGPVHFSLSTWTAARHEIQALARLRDEGKLLSLRWLCDFTFVRRDPEAAHQLRQTFGLDCIRVAHVHSKFALFINAEWKLCLRTSMNLNMNPRFEDFTIGHDPALATFMGRFMDEVWRKQDRRLSSLSTGEIRRHFILDL